MPTQVQFRRGTTSQNNSFTGAAGEISVDTEKNTIRVHDGTTAGGSELATLTGTATLTNKTISGSSNTLSDIGNASLTNSSVTINANSLSLGGTLTLDTDDVSEGSTNLYYTDARARNALSITDVSGDGSLTYNSETGTITYTGPSAEEVRAHFSSGTGVTFSNGQINIGQAVSTTSDVTFNDVTVSGDLTVLGTTTSINTETITLADNTIVLNSNETGEPSQNSGIEIERGVRVNASLLWDETNDYWSVGLAGNEVPVVTTSATQTLTNKTIDAASNIISNIANSSLTNSSVTINSNSLSLGSSLTLDTDDIGEGSTNLYHTDARARGAISVTDSGGDGSLSYDSGTGVITYTGPSAEDVRAHLSAGTGLTFTSGAFTIDSTVATLTGTQTLTNKTIDAASNTLSNIGNSSLTNSSITINGTSTSLGGTRTLVTDDIAEDGSPTNLWYTDARSRTAISVTDSGGDGSLSYNSETGVITYTGPSASEVRAHFSAGSNITIVDGVISGSAAYTDTNARNAISVSGGLTYDANTGVITLTGYNNSNWDTAYSWGDHAQAGYLLESEAYSDMRLKNKVGEISNPLEMISQISGFLYTNNDLAKSFGFEGDEIQIGLSAQEVEKVVPGVVKLAAFDKVKDEDGNVSSKSGENYLTLNYAKLIPVLIEAIKEQQKQIDLLKEQILNN